MLADMKRTTKKKLEKVTKPINRTGVGVTIYMDPDLKRELTRYTLETRRTITGEIEEAIRRLLEKEGYWPPKTEAV
jgi:hypothetical protein